MEHSVVLEVDKCRGCTTCLHNCPTKAIRVRNGKAMILADKCIECGECIRVCPYHAKIAQTDELSSVKSYPYKVALIPPTLIAQFHQQYEIGDILLAIEQLGFDLAVEVAYGAEIAGKALDIHLKKHQGHAYISSACPAVVKLIQERFPLLIDYILDLKAPVQITAEYVKERLEKEQGLKKEDIGLFFITPCAAKATDIATNMKEAHIIDGAIALNKIYADIKKGLEKNKQLPPQPMRAGSRGLKWAVSGGEAAFITEKQTLNVDGIGNIIDLLEEIERGKLNHIDFIECLACTGGCVGGCLTVENTFVAKKRLLTHVEDEAGKGNTEVLSDEEIASIYESGKLFRREPYRCEPVKPLDPDMGKAIEKMFQIDEIANRLPGFNCGSCGSPGCRTLAEDIVQGKASELDCIFMLKEAITNLSKDVLEISQKVVPVMHHEGDKDD